uniref:Uncharacterized protein n=1 Tax=Rhipicephalus appendiculatus TaxID=34631 RepID=A0A131Y9Y7_RHIAP
MHSHIISLPVLLVFAIALQKVSRKVSIQYLDMIYHVCIKNDMTYLHFYTVNLLAFSVTYIIIALFQAEKKKEKKKCYILSDIDFFAISC